MVSGALLKVEPAVWNKLAKSRKTARRTLARALDVVTEFDPP